MMNAQEIVMRMLRGEREITIKCGDERSAMGLYQQVQIAIKALGFSDRLPDVSVRLAPEAAIVSWGGVEKHQILGEWTSDDLVFPEAFILHLREAHRITDREAYAMSRARYERGRARAPDECADEVPDWAISALREWQRSGPGL